MDHHGGLDLQSGQSLEEDLMQGLRDTVRLSSGISLNAERA